MKYIKIIIIILCCAHNVIAQKDSIDISKSVLLESRPYAPLTGNTLGSNNTIAGICSAEKGNNSFFLMKGVDLLDENSGANYFFTQYTHKKVYKKMTMRYIFLTSIAQPNISFDPHFSMSGIGVHVSTKTYPQYEFAAHYIVPWQSSSPNIIIKNRLVWEKPTLGAISFNAWYNSGMFGKNTGALCGVDLSSKKLHISNDVQMTFNFVYNYNVAGNMLGIENPSSQNVVTFRMFLLF